MNIPNKSKEYETQVNELQEKVPGLLEDFQKYYVFYNKNPSYTEYQTFYEEKKSHLEKVTSDLFVVTNSVQKDTNTLNQQLDTLNQWIETEKVKNKKLRKQMGGLQNTYNSSGIMIDEYKEIYNYSYLRNFSMLLGIVLLAFLLRRNFAQTRVQ